jgi:RimJ/RimL family protein N-acetyltransferase
MILTTPRLTLREFRFTDLPDLHAIYRDPAVRRYEGPVLDETESSHRLQAIMADQIDHPRLYFNSAITLNPADQLIGWIALHVTNPAIQEYEIGWTLSRQAWGKGYATEAARAAMGFVFEQQMAHRLVAFCHAQNAASERVMQRLGMAREGCLRETRWLNSEWCDELIYSILEREYFDGKLP